MLGIRYLFLVELWERFSFYGFRALLFLYMTSQLLYSEEKAYGIYAAFLALSFSSPLLGGIIADKVLGVKNTIELGCMFLMSGYVCLILCDYQINSFYLGLSFICIGSGLFKPNLVALINEILAPNDPERDSCYTYLYAIAHLGACVAPFFCSLIGEIYGWRYAFAISTIAMISSYYIFSYLTMQQPTLGVSNNEDYLQQIISLGVTRKNFIYLSGYMLVPGLSILITNYSRFIFLIPIVALLTVVYLIKLISQATHTERTNLWVIYALLAGQTIFFAIIAQQSSVLTLFTAQYVNHFFWGYEFTTQQLQLLNPYFLIIIAPVIAEIFRHARVKPEYNNPILKLIMGILSIGIGFAILSVGIAVNGNNLVNLSWVFAANTFFVIGEVLLVPVSLAIVTQLLKQQNASTIIAAWFISLSLAQYVANLFGQNLAPNFLMVFSINFGVLVIIVMLLSISLLRPAGSSFTQKRV